MTVPTTALGAELVAEALTHQGEQIQARDAAMESILAVYAGLQMKDALSSWTSGIGERIYVLLSILQQLIVGDSADYVMRILRLQNLVPTGPRPNPDALAGIASDMRDLESLLAGAVVKVRQAQRAGEGDAVAFKRGQDYLKLVVTTQAADTSRAAESVAAVLAAPQRPDATAPAEVTLGWVRMLNPPSCGRCVALAGRFYRWSDGFERHDMCDCRHIPVTESVAEDVTVNPQAYFESLSEDEQNNQFGVAVAQAIRDGGDISQVVNAATRPGGMFTADRGRRYTREGTTRKGFYGRNANGVRRPTPWQIYQDAHGDRDLARQMLARFGYVIQ